MDESAGTAPSSPLTPDHVRLVRQSWRLLESKQSMVAKLFYTRMFQLEPSLEKLFRATDMEQQRKKFSDTITVAVKGLDHFEVLVPAIGQLGQRHTGYGVREEHYGIVKMALLESLGTHLGESFAGETEEAWSITYDVLAEIMKRGPSGEWIAISALGGT